MKNLCFIAVIALFSFTSVQAQDLKFGAKAGVNFATISGDVIDGAKSRTSLHVGVVAEIPISDKLSVQPELLYSAQGAEFDSSIIKSTLKLDYLNLPILVKYYVADNLSLEAGPQVGFLLSAKADVEGNTNNDATLKSINEDVDIKDNISSIDFGLKFGAGYTLESGLNFGAHYNLGLSNLNDTETSDTIEQFNGVFQVSIGFFF